jgi:hypothetical protein
MDPTNDLDDVVATLDQPRIMCWGCGRRHTVNPGGHRWADGLTWPSGAMCEQCAHDLARREDQLDRAYRADLRRWADELADPGVTAYVDRMDNEARLYRQLPADQWRANGLLSPPPQFPPPGFRAFRDWLDRNPTTGDPSPPQGPTARRRRPRRPA